jgi:cell wall-associated NlpC family hydrolase
MRFIVPAFTLSLCLALSAHAAPALQQSPETDTLQAPPKTSWIDRNLKDPFQQVRETVVSRASDLVVTAIAFLDVPYKYGGETVETGFDCSGFVRAIYDQTAGYLLPRRAAEQAAATQEIDRDELKPGDLVFFNTMRRAFSHVGIYVGDGRFIHAPRTGAQIRLENMRGSYWQRRFNGARRVITAQDDDSAELRAATEPAQ